MKSSIPCPVCNTPIPFDPMALSKGTRFSCPSCPKSTIGIEPESLNKLKQTLDDLLKLKQQTVRGTDGGVSPLGQS